MQPKTVTPSRCRVCKTPKWPGDPCVNPECPTNTKAPGFGRKPRHVISLAHPHFLHAPNQTPISVDSYLIGR